MKKLSYTVFWILQWTWGFIMTFIGGVAALALLITGHKPHTLGPNIYFKLGHLWGGVSFGPFFFCCEEANEETYYHECGHGLQNLVWGPLMPFAIAIPSFVRYHLRNQKTQLQKGLFNLYFLLISFFGLTAMICVTGLIFHWHWVTHCIEFIRDYFIFASLWLTLFEIPLYANGHEPDYDAIWFEGQATRWGKKVYEKKED